MVAHRDARSPAHPPKTVPAPAAHVRAAESSIASFIKIKACAENKTDVMPVHEYEPFACALVLAQMMKNEMNSIKKKNEN